MKKSLTTWFTRMTVVLMFLFVLSGKEGRAQNIVSYHPLARALALGKSFDLFNPSNNYASSIFSSFNTERSGPTSQQVYMSVVDNKESYRKTLHIDASLDASFLSIFHANGNYSNDESELYSASNLTICIIGEADYGDFRVASPVLNPAAAALVNDPTGFKQKFGEFYVSSVKKMQFLYVFITLSNLTTQMKQQMAAELGAGGGFAIFSADLQGRVNKLVEQFRNSHSVQLRVKSFGRNALRELPLADITADFFANGTFSTNTYDAIMRYINANFSAENSSEVEYSYSPLSQFGYRNDDYFYKINRKFEKYIDLCGELKRYYDFNNEVRQTRDCPAYSLVTTEDDDYINTTRRKVSDRIDDIYDALSACRDSTCTTLSTCCKINDIDIPVDNNRLDKIRNRYLSPLNELCSFQSTAPTRYDLRQSPYGGGLSVDIFPKQGNNYTDLNITPDNQHSYTIQTALDFINAWPGRATYVVTTLVNGYPMGSTPLQAEGNSVVHYFFNSEPFPVGNKFNNRLPENVVVHVELANYQPVGGGNNFFIVMLPYSRLLFYF